MEFVVILRRALAQQAPVKQALYRGIAAIFAADPASVDLLLPMLLPHLQNYVTMQVRLLAPLALVPATAMAAPVIVPSQKEVREPSPTLLEALPMCSSWCKVQAPTAGGQPKFSLDLSNLLVLSEETNKATVKDALPELLVCALAAAATRDGSDNGTAGALLALQRLLF